MLLWGRPMTQAIREHSGRAGTELSPGHYRALKKSQPTQLGTLSLSPHSSGCMCFQSLVLLKCLNISLSVNLPYRDIRSTSLTPKLSHHVAFQPASRIYPDSSPSHCKYYHNTRILKTPAVKPTSTHVWVFLIHIWGRWIFQGSVLRIAFHINRHSLYPCVSTSDLIKMKKRRKTSIHLNS